MNVHSMSLSMSCLARFRPHAHASQARDEALADCRTAAGNIPRARWKQQFATPAAAAAAADACLLLYLFGLVSQALP